jgi:hypothetical protein
MSAACDLVLLQDAYRDDGDLAYAGSAQLEAAAEALTMTLLTLAGELDEDRGDKIGRAAQARGFLLEAVTALSRARVYNPRIRTLAPPTLLATERRVEAELSRLHQITTRLLWQNHKYLPARLQAQPLAPHEEAALRDVFRGLARHARIGRALRHRGTIVALTVLLAAPLVAVPFAYLATFATLCAAATLVARGRARGEGTRALHAVNPS